LNRGHAPPPEPDLFMKSRTQFRRLAPRAHAQAGFTLLEMLIVLVIIGLLVGLVGPQLLGRVDQGRVTTAQAQIQMIKGALDTFRLDLGRYPTTEEGLRALEQAPDDPRAATAWKGPYLQGAVPNDPWNAPYRYRRINNNQIELYSLGADGAPGGEDLDADLGILPQGAGAAVAR
jgi:general secretion pathway protein G